MQQIKKELAKLISGIIGSIGADIPETDILPVMEYPPDSDMGDLSLPCFRFSKALRKPPVKIAEELAPLLEKQNGGMIKSVASVNGYLNIFVNDTTLSQNVLNQITEEGSKYGSENIGMGRMITMDYSSPNIAKPFHIAHLRSTAIGHSIRNIMEFMGFKVFAINYLGDWGTQNGQVITAYKLWCDDISVIEQNGILELLKLYVRFHEEAENDPSLKDLARGWFKKLESGDEEALYLWKRFKEITLAEYMKTYELIGIKFDSYDGESFFTDKMDAVVEELKQKNLLKIDQGASIVDLEEYKMPPCLILKTDGSTLYPTRDIASAMYRKKTYDFHKNLYVVGTPQALHFSQWIKVVELMGYEWANDCVYINFGNLSIEGEMMGTRKGNMIRLQDVFDTAIEKVRGIIEEKNPALSPEQKEDIAKKVGVGAVIFNDLSAGRIKDINFSWEEALNFDGNSGPYLQYTYARICGVLSKAEISSAEGNISSAEGNDSPALSGYEITDPTERELLKLLAVFPEKVKIAARDYEPSVISRYALDLAADFNRFYNNCNILKASDSVKSFRLSLCRAAQTVLGSALNLLGLAQTEVV